VTLTLVFTQNLSGCLTITRLQMNRAIVENPQLDGNSFTLTGSGDTGIILFHGFTSTTVEVRPLGEYLHSQGLQINAPLLPGHGINPEDALQVKRSDWLAAAENAFNLMASTQRNIFVAGESMGALLALHLAKEHPEICGVILFAPAIRISGQWLSPLLAPFIQFQPKRYLSDDSKPPEEDSLPWQGYNVLPIPAVAQFYRLQQQVKRELAAISQPILIFQGGKDGTINPDGAHLIMERLGSVDKKLIWIENGTHTLLLGREHPEIYRQTLDFIARVTGQLF